tara:strand:+ start:6701 stop:7129 length:429 start_codon:yes stop_codon:yes gene_type:complete
MKDNGQVNVTGNYDWNKPTKPIVENGARERQQKYGLIPKTKEQEVTDTIKEMDRTMRKVQKVYKTISEDDKEKIKDIILMTEIDGITPREKLAKRRDSLYPYYRKYVDPKSKKTGCGSCIASQSKFFELLVRYMKEYEQESQ